MRGRYIQRARAMSVDGNVVVDSARVVVFLAFVGLAIRARRERDDAVRGRRVVGWFVAFTVFLSMGVGFGQREAWPFSHWPMDNARYSAEYSGLRPVVVDRGGKEHEVDLRAFYPIDWWDLYDWLSRTPGRDPGAFNRVAPWLVDHLAAARRQLEVTGHLPGARGVLRAPPRVVSTPVWTAGDGLTPLNIVGLRVYEFHTNLDHRPVFGANAPRDLVFEYVRDD